jgi:HEAT repeat protein
VYGWAITRGAFPSQEYDGDPQMRARAEAAVRKAGTNAIPWLLVELSAKEATRGDEMPTNFYFGEAIGRRWLVATAFEIFGASARDATPTLMPLLDKQTSYTAATALGSIGVESMPVLTQALTNTHACARESAARVLGLFGAKAQNAIPALVRCAGDKDDSVRGFATFSLGQIGQAPEVVVPVLIMNLRDPYHSARWNAACALGKFGDKAKPAVPALLKVLHEDDPDVRDIATDALHQIEPEAAAKAGVK